MAPFPLHAGNASQIVHAVVFQVTDPKSRRFVVAPGVCIEGGDAERGLLAAEQRVVVHDFDRKNEVPGRLQWR